MATRAKLPANDAPDVVGEIILVPVAQIDIGKRLRPVDPVWASALGKVMAAEGQKTPIEICRLPTRNDWTLVAGAHRVTGAEMAGIGYLTAIVVEADPAERLNREISENLWRRGLDPLDRAAFIAELVTLHKQRHGVDPAVSGRAVSAATRWQKVIQDDAEDANATIAFAYGWADDVGERLGLSRRTIEYDLLLHRRIPAGLIARLRAHDGGAGHSALRNGAQLRMLAKLDEAQQAAAVDRLLWEEAPAGRVLPKTLAEAIAFTKHNQKPQPEDKRLSAFIGNFHRMGVAEKKGALAQLVGSLSGPLADVLIGEMKKAGWL